jgi:hypothetical protein
MPPVFPRREDDVIVRLRWQFAGIVPFGDSRSELEPDTPGYDALEYAPTVDRAPRRRLFGRSVSHRYLVLKLPFIMVEVRSLLI